MHRVRRLVRTPIAWLYERCQQRLFHRSPEKNPAKTRVVRQFYATGQKKCNTFGKHV
jgi:hypothetical protein